MSESGWYDSGEVKPRIVSDNPRCSECKTGPMFHPTHKWGPCSVPLPWGDRCPCTGVIERSTADTTQSSHEVPTAN